MCAGRFSGGVGGQGAGSSGGWGGSRGRGNSRAPLCWGNYIMIQIIMVYIV